MALGATYEVLRHPGEGVALIERNGQRDLWAIYAMTNAPTNA